MSRIPVFIERGARKQWNNFGEPCIFIACQSVDISTDFDPVSTDCSANSTKDVLDVDVSVKQYINNGNDNFDCNSNLIKKCFDSSNYGEINCSPDSVNETVLAVNSVNSGDQECHSSEQNERLIDKVQLNDTLESRFEDTDIEIHNTSNAKNEKNCVTVNYDSYSKVTESSDNKSGIQIANDHIMVNESINEGSVATVELRTSEEQTDTIDVANNSEIVRSLIPRPKKLIVGKVMLTAAPVKVKHNKSKVNKITKHGADESKIDKNLQYKSNFKSKMQELIKKNKGNIKEGNGKTPHIDGCDETKNSDKTANCNVSSNGVVVSENDSNYSKINRANKFGYMYQFNSDGKSASITHSELNEKVKMEVTSSDGSKTGSDKHKVDATCTESAMFKSHQELEDSEPECAQHYMNNGIDDNSNSYIEQNGYTDIVNPLKVVPSNGKPLVIVPSKGSGIPTATKRHLKVIGNQSVASFVHRNGSSVVLPSSGTDNGVVNLVKCVQPKRSFIPKLSHKRTTNISNMETDLKTTYTEDDDSGSCNRTVNASNSSTVGSETCKLSRIRSVSPEPRTNVFNHISLDDECCKNNGVSANQSQTGNSLSEIEYNTDPDQNKITDTEKCANNDNHHDKQEIKLSKLQKTFSRNSSSMKDRLVGKTNGEAAVPTNTSMSTRHVRNIQPCSTPHRNLPQAPASIRTVLIGQRCDVITPNNSMKYHTKQG